MRSFHHPNSFVEEGVDHINISSQSKTHLGKLLDPSYFKVINYPHIGKFSSVLNLWYWLKSEQMDDRLRNYTGLKLKAIAPHAPRYRTVTNFRAIIAYATYLKLKDYPNSIREITGFSDDMQFASYYTPKGSMVRMCSSYAPLVVEVAQFIQAQLLKPEPVCFDKMATEVGKDEYFYLEPFLKSRLNKTDLP